MLGNIHKGRPAKTGISRPSPFPSSSPALTPAPHVRLSGFNNTIPRMVTIDARFSKTPSNGYAGRTSWMPPHISRSKVIAPNISPRNYFFLINNVYIRPKENICFQKSPGETFTWPEEKSR